MNLHHYRISRGGGDILLDGRDMIVAVNNTYYYHDVVFEGNVAIGTTYANLAQRLQISYSG